MTSRTRRTTTVLALAVLATSALAAAPAPKEDRVPPGHVSRVEVPGGGGGVTTQGLSWL